MPGNRFHGFGAGEPVERTADKAVRRANLRRIARLFKPYGSRLAFVQTLHSNKVGQRVMHDLRTAVYRHLQRMSLAFFTRTRTGEVQSRIANDIGGVDDVVTSTATSVVSNVTTVLATIVAMLLLDWRLAVFALALLPIFVWMTRRVGDQ